MDLSMSKPESYVKLLRDPSCIGGHLSTWCMWLTKARVKNFEWCCHFSWLVGGTRAPYYFSVDRCYDLFLSMGKVTTYDSSRLGLSHFHTSPSTTRRRTTTSILASLLGVLQCRLETEFDFTWSRPMVYNSQQSIPRGTWREVQSEFISEYH